MAESTMCTRILWKALVAQLVGCFFTLCVSGQPIDITGHVYSAVTNDALEGANVVITGYSIGASTDMQGEYHLSVPSPGTYEVVASFVGYETKSREIAVSENEAGVFDFLLKESIISIKGICVQSAREGITVTNRMTIIDVGSFAEATRVHRLEEILERMAGIDIYRTGTVANPSQLVAVRGCNDVRFVVAVDGRAWSSPSHEDCPIDWSALTTEDVERIEIIRGGGSVLYDGAMGGIINIIRKKGVPGTGLVRPRISGRIGADAFRSMNGSLGISGGVGMFGYALSSGIDFSSGYLRNESVEGYDIAGNVFYQIPSMQGKISVALKRHMTDFGYPVINDPKRSDYDPDYPVVADDVDLIRKWNDNVYPGGVSTRKKTMNFADIIWEQPIHRTQMTLNIFGNAGFDTTCEHCYQLTAVVDTVSGDTTLVPILEQLVSVSNEYTYGASIRVEVSNIEQHTFTFGADYRNLGAFPIESGYIMGVAVEGSEAIPDWFRLVGVFAEDQFKASRAINITLGLRYAYLDEWTMPTYENPTTGDSGRVHFYYNAALPKFSVSYSFPDSTMIYGSVNRDWHVPNC